MDERVIEARLRKLNAYVTGLRRFQRVTRQEYLNDEDLQAIVERRLQLAIQVCLDLANYIIAHGRREVPDREENVFLTLARHGVIDQTLGERVKAMTRFRNILVHDYLDIDQAKVYEKLAGGFPDFDEFARAIVVWLNRESGGCDH
ncbi:MAG TPA: DUF86 domain-containing protein [Bacillota bacterium]|nr:DUF86 domain-containing protein [Bacillota bacterium]